MQMWTGQGVFQWEHCRRWVLDAGSEYCRADGALVLPGFNSLSVFFRRQSQTGGTFTLKFWTAPIYFKLLDEPIDQTNVAALLHPLLLQPGALTMTGMNPQMFGARIAPDQAMGSLLFWEMENAGSAQTIVGDLYVVPNYTGTMGQPTIARTVDVTLGSGQGQSLLNSTLRR